MGKDSFRAVTKQTKQDLRNTHNGIVNLGTVQQALNEREKEIKKTEREKKKNFRINKSA